MRPKVSVIMPAYNAALYIKEAIQSILMQTFTDFELIVINDGSTDKTLSVIQSFSDNRIRLINNNKNQGIIASRNIGLNAANGEYIAKMDADDYSLPTRLERQVNYLDTHPWISVVACKLAIMDEAGTLTTVWPEDYYISSIEQIKNTLPKINCIGQPTAMMRTKVAKSITYNKNYLYNEDWGFWLDVLLKKHVIAKLDEVLLYYRVHAKGTTVKENTKNVELKTIKFRLNYLSQNYFHLNTIVFAVIKGLIPDVLKFLSPNILLRFYKFFSLGPFNLLRAYMGVKHQISKSKGNITHLFFFPYYHAGGAEKVHASILSTVANKKPLVFITAQSKNSALLKDFAANAIIAEVNLLIQFGPSYRWLKRQIEMICKQNPQAVLFGCNSKFYYELLPSLPSNTKAIDLIHAFVHTYEDGPEKWSLPLIDRITKRVVISENSIKDLSNLYQKNSINKIYINRILCISNFVNLPPFEKKTPGSMLNVLYVGRGSSEKRIHLISNAARICSENKIPAKFHFVGDTSGFIPNEDLNFCHIYNEIHDPNELIKIYKITDVLVIASSREGFPMVIMEAMANGVVPLSTNVGGISAHVKHNQNGLLIDDKEEIKITSSIVGHIELLLNDKHKLNNLSEAAYKYASQNFKKEVFFDSYSKLLT